MITKILVASDFLMTKEREQYSNRRWLRDILTRPVERATGIKPASVSSSLTQPDLISRASFFEHSGIELDADALQFWYDCDLVNEESVNYLKNFIKEDSLIIGYELSLQTRTVLTRMGVTYIDMWLHPIRFMDDILFAFNTNNEAIRNRLQRYNLSEDHFHLYADRLRIQSYKGFKRSEPELPPGTALFVGQLMEDKAVCRDGTMLNLLSFKEQFETLLNDHPRVLYSRHPHLKKGDEEIVAYLKGQRKVRISDIPAYDLLASPRVTKVMGISSSVILEAKYFGKQIEFLFKPIISISDTIGEENYASVYQEFVSPSFWADILEPVMETQNCPRVTFLDSKDKVRDMLNFYWSYREIDKVEAMRQRQVQLQQQVSGLVKNMPKVSPAATSKPVSALAKATTGAVKKTTPAKPRLEVLGVQADLDKLVAKMADHDVISFDLFDTLVERPLERADDIFVLMAPKVAAMTGGVIDDFVEARKMARDMAKKDAVGEEVPLDLRYRALASARGLDMEMAERMLALEEETELAVCGPKAFGQLAYEAALRLDKKVVIITDTFFSQSFIDRLLEASGYTRHQKVYVSSTIGLLKHTGSLFKHVIDDLAVVPGKVLHIGDNPRADIKMAESHGIIAFHVPATPQIYSSESPTAPAMRFADRMTQGCLRGLAGQAWARLDRPLSRSHTFGDPRLFGFAVAGPLFMGFAHWVLDQAKRDGVETIHFLSRDGAIVKRCYDLLAAHDKEAPTAKYTYASRRAIHTASWRTPDDLVAALGTNFSPTSLETLLTNRFGIQPDDLPTAVWGEHGMAGPGARISFVGDQEKLAAFFSDPRVADPILANAAEEREALLAYYGNQGLKEGGKTAIVDIGHFGTLQKGMAKLLDRDLGGYYFTTFKGASEGLAKVGLTARGYVGEDLDPADKTHPYARDILMFELLFLNDHGSLLRMRQGDEHLEPVFLPTDGEEKRIGLALAVHEGAVDFVRVACAKFGDDVRRISPSGPEAIAAYASLIKSPARQDAMLFEGVAFENKWSARNVQYIIAPVEEKNGRVAASLWADGLQALGSDIPTELELPRWWEPTLMRFLGERKYRKFRRSPEKFFEDSHWPLARRLGKLVTRQLVHS
ncbi:HAD family hydrolase [Skermanella stibiiresistens]|nr:HAD family hydrolase [Skermanella stibiiresistens]